LNFNFSPAMSRFPNLQFKLLRLLFGLPILGLGAATKNQGFWLSPSVRISRRESLATGWNSATV
jgi:hypothetical protein